MKTIQFLVTFFLLTLLLSVPATAQESYQQDSQQEAAGQRTFIKVFNPCTKQMEEFNRENGVALLECLFRLISTPVPQTETSAQAQGSAAVQATPAAEVAKSTGATGAECPASWERVSVILRPDGIFLRPEDPNNLGIILSASRPRKVDAQSCNRFEEVAVCVKGSELLLDGKIIQIAVPKTKLAASAAIQNRLDALKQLLALNDSGGKYPTGVEPLASFNFALKFLPEALRPYAVTRDPATFWWDGVNYHFCSQGEESAPQPVVGYRNLFNAFEKDVEKGGWISGSYRDLSWKARAFLGKDGLLWAKRQLANPMAIRSFRTSYWSNLLNPFNLSNVTVVTREEIVKAMYPWYCATTAPFERMASEHLRGIRLWGKYSDAAIGMFIRYHYDGKDADGPGAVAEIQLLMKDWMSQAEVALPTTCLEGKYLPPNAAPVAGGKQ